MKLSARTTRAMSACALLACGGTVHAQISLQSAVNLALKNSPKVKMGQADVAKARAARGEARDAYVPVIATTAGYGQATGAPLGVPIIFSISAQSLLFSFSQKDYIRSTEASLRAAEDALHATEVEIVEDTTNTYLALDNSLELHKVLRQEQDLADRLVQMTGQRIYAGVDAKVELPKSRRTATQIRLAALHGDDDLAAYREHLAQLTGLPASSLTTDRSSIPDFGKPAPVSPAPANDEVADSDGIRAAFETAKAKQYVAFGDQRYLFRPQISLASNYSRVDTGLSSYASYYPRYQGTAENPNSQNSLSFGLQITVPLLDLGHRNKARQSAADAMRAYAEAEMQRGTFREGRAKLQNAAVELDLKAQLAHDEQEIAADQLETVKLQLQADAANVATTQATPKDQLSAQLQERQKYVDVLNAELQLRQTQVNLMRQTDGLGRWILASPGSRSITPTIPAGTPGANVPAAPGTAVPGSGLPGGAVPGLPGAAPPAAPLGGGTPSPLPSAPTPH